MKNKLKIFLCVVMILIFSFGTCATAYAYTGYPTDVSKADTICRSYYADELVGSDSVFLFKTDNNGTALLYLPSIYYSDKSIPIIARGENNNLVFVSNGHNFYLFFFDKQNCYSKPKMEVFSNNGNGTHHIPYGITTDNIKSRIVSSAKTILDVDGQTVLFQQGTNPSPNPNPETPPLTPGSNTLSTMFNKNSAMLKGVLNEIITLLPLLLPVLISFLAIRKGIMFTLQTLRSS